jgi:hypothetical protein
MFPSFAAPSLRPSLGFWVNEGLAPGLTLAGFTPAGPADLAPDEVFAERRCRFGTLLRFVSRRDIETAP